jgi:hypothetical protein
MLADAAAQAGVPVEATLHDYYAICPRINLVGASGVHCGEPEPAACDRCLRRADPPLPVRSIVAWRDDARRLLARAAKVRVPDQDVAQRMARHFPGLDMEVTPHEPDPGLERPRRREPRPAVGPDAPAHLVIPGALGVIKGFDVLRELATTVRDAGLPLRLTLLGYSPEDAALQAAGVEVLGRYDEATLAERLSALDPDLVWIPSVWPETWSYVLSAAFAAGLPVAVFDLGAQARRVREHGGADRCLPLSLASDPAALARELGARVDALRASAAAPAAYSPS